MTDQAVMPDTQAADELADLGYFDPEGDAADQLASQETPTVADDEQVNRLLRALARRRAEVERCERLAAADAERIERWLAEATNAPKAQIAFIESSLAEWHRVQLEKDAKRKTIPFPNGTLKSTAPNSKEPFALTVDADAFGPWADECGLAVRGDAPPPPVVKSKVKEAFALGLTLDTIAVTDDGQVVDTETGEPIPGLMAEKRQTSFKATTEAVS